MKSIATLLLLLAAVYTRAQISALPTNIRASNTLERLYDSDGLGRSDILYGIPLPPGGLVGDTYYDAAWKPSAVMLYQKETLIKGYPTRYDLQQHELELKSKAGVKVLKADKVKSFVLIDSLSGAPVYFVNARDYSTEGDIVEGFFEVLVDGKRPLFKRNFVTIKKADYKVQFDMGSRDDKVFKKSDLYYAVANVTYEIPGSRKKLLAVFGDKSDAMEQFMEDKKLSTNRESDLVQIFTYYNTLVSAQ